VIDDSKTIADTLKGDTDAFGKLVEKYQDRLFNMLVHLIGNHEDAKDVAQEAFVQAFVKLNTFQGVSAFYTWLYRIALNLAAGQRRRQRPVTSLEHQREQFGLDPMDNNKGPSRIAEQKEQAKKVHNALQRLNEEHQAVLMLREIGNFSYEDIAEILELPVGTIRSRIHRARMQLRDEFGKFTNAKKNKT
jgi:RNA polymerase sigma-70 factor, ECF subfamily